MSQIAPLVLAVDDNEDGLFALEQLLKVEGYRVIAASDGRQTLELMRKMQPDLVLLDVVMPELDGFGVINAAKQDPELKYIPIILLTAKHELSEIVEGLERGADDYVLKPYQRDVLLARLKAVLRLGGLYKQLKQAQQGKGLQSNDYNPQSKQEPFRFEELVGRSDSMQQLYQLIERAADSNAAILISAESGTGKELVARAIHARSKRAKKPFITQNCSALSEQLLESELFGHVRGAFSGAERDKQGLFDAANQGTFFLDELGEMSPKLQAKLLRVIQDGSFTPVGSTQEKRVDVRVVAATNRNLVNMISEGTFREDLYYRLSVISIGIPPLRERRSDILELVDHFLLSSCQKHSKPKKILREEALRILLDYSWPGNVRQLQNEVERLVILSAQSEEIPLSLISHEILSAVGSLGKQSRAEEPPRKLSQIIELVEREAIERELKRADWNKSEAARVLGISRSSLIAKAKQYGIDKG